MLLFKIVVLRDLWANAMSVVRPTVCVSRAAPGEKKLVLDL